MKKALCILSAAAVLSSSVALAAPMTIDLEEMTPAELRTLQAQVKDEYDRATEFSSDDYSLLASNFKEAFETLVPSDATVSYPFFGFEKTRERCMYKLSGECTIKFPDKTKKSMDMSMIYWHDEENQTFHQVAFYSKERIYYCDNDLLAHVDEYLDESTLAFLGADEITYTAQEVRVTPSPTNTPSQTTIPINADPSAFSDSIASPPDQIQLYGVSPSGSPIHNEPDQLQELFMFLTSETTADKFEAEVKASKLPYAKQEFNKSSDGRALSYIVAYSEDSALFKYAESGDHLEVTFDTGKSLKLMFAEYNPQDSWKSALFYQYGTWWKFSDSNAKDYSGYYIVDHNVHTGGINIEYSNGRETETNYFPYPDAKTVIEALY